MSTEAWRTAIAIGNLVAATIYWCMCCWGDPSKSTNRCVRACFFLLVAQRVESQS